MPGGGGMSSAPTRPVLRYHGGKWRLAPWIIQHFPPHRIYVESFGGGASVLMRKPRVYSEVYNDRWDLVVNVFRVLRDERSAQRLAQLLALTPYSRAEFEKTGSVHVASIEDPIERARLSILRSLGGFGSASTNASFSTGFRANSMRSGTTPAHDWANYPANVASFTERLRGVLIENRPAVDVIQHHDSPESLHYVDPPYPHDTRNMQRGNAAYVHEMSDDDHRELANALRGARGMVVISGYPCDLYDSELYRSWHRVSREAFADGARPRTEVLWLNDAAASRLEGGLFA
jgi:DNA adenine methylase